MRILLILLITFMTLSVAFDFDPGPAPGVKIKNALLYLIFLGLLLRAGMTQRFRLQLPAMPLLFATLIAYALLTYLVIVLVLDYPRYSWLQSGFMLKNLLVDQMFFWLVFFYGLSTDEEALGMLKWLLICWIFSHVIAVGDALGFIQVGDVELRGDGRVQGTIGESNQYGAFAAYGAPAIAALIFATRGVRRVWWAAAALLTAIALLMTVSRGAYVAIAVALAVGFALFRRYAPPGRLALFAAVIAAGSVLLVAVVMALGFGELLTQRVVGGTTLGDIETTSSGRTEIWASAIGAMFENPVTLLTGYGWNAYNAMPFRYAPHNYYIAYWFNLGVPGLLCTLLLFYVPVRTARTAVNVASAEVRPVLMGFVLATVAIATATFFVDLYAPWPFYWVYSGIVMRLAVNALERGAMNAPVVHRATPAPVSAADPFGWAGALRRR